MHDRDGLTSLMLTLAPSLRVWRLSFEQRLVVAESANRFQEMNAMMLDAEAVKGWSWKEVLRGRMNSQRRNRHHNTRIYDSEIKDRLGANADTWEQLVAKDWEEAEEAWKQKLRNDLTRIDACAHERKAADEEFIRKSKPFFDEEGNAMGSARTGLPGGSALRA